ncbi:Nucleoid occlusion protein [subsurface metagenome]
MEAIFRSVNMNLIDRPEDLARLEIDQGAIQSLADSIRERGLQQPIKVARREGRFKIVFGDRRYLACKKLGLTKIKATVVDASDEEIAIDRAIENLQRVDLTPVEEALQYQGMIDKLGMKAEDIERMIGKELRTVYRKLALLKYPEGVKDAVHSGKVSLTVAEVLMSCPDEGHRDYLFQAAIENGITVAIARNWLDDWRKAQMGKPSGVPGAGIGEPSSFQRKSYIACGLCNEAVEIGKLESINICPACLAQLYDMLHKGEHQTG